jgi:ABC-type multidrug transport system ATPase subunit
MDWVFPELIVQHAMIMSTSTLAIETVGLSKFFGRRCAARAINLAIPQGAVFGFLGPNGAGKTTTIRMLLGLVRPTSGNGRILGYDIQRERAAILPYVGALVESPAFYPYLSGQDNLRILMRTARQENPRRIAEVLEQVALTHCANDRVRTYSLGMKQRLAIAAALLNHPRILFLDEPTNGLDPAGTVEIRQLIRQLGSAGHTIFLSSHQLHEVEQVCTDVAIINRGQMITQGRVTDLTCEGAALLVVAEPLALLQVVAERFGVQPQVLDARTARLPLASEQIPKLVAALVNAGADVHQVTPQHSTLEQRFLELTAAGNGAPTTPDQPAHR